MPSLTAKVPVSSECCTSGLDKRSGGVTLPLSLTVTCDHCSSRTEFSQGSQYLLDYICLQECLHRSVHIHVHVQ